MISLILGGLIWLHTTLVKYELNVAISAKDKEIAELMGKMNSTNSEKNESIIDKKAASYALEYVEKDNFNLKQENRDLSNRSNSLVESLGIYKKQIDDYNSRIHEVSSFDATELYDNQFLVSFLEITKNDTPIVTQQGDYGPGTYVNAEFYYIGNYDIIESDRATYSNLLNVEHSTHWPVGNVMSIKYGKFWYGIRILSINKETQKIKFSSFISDYQP